jgi:hypothetical protein
LAEFECLSFDDGDSAVKTGAKPCGWNIWISPPLPLSDQESPVRRVVMPLTALKLDLLNGFTIGQDQPLTP